MDPSKSPLPSPPGRASLWLAFGWGLAESTVFFIVPDVLTSRLVLQKPAAGFRACFTSLAGALLGGLVLYQCGRTPGTAESILDFFIHLPGINPALVDQAADGLTQHGPVALFTGVLAGIPYKLYAVQAAGTGMGLGGFLLSSMGARLSRFLVVTGFSWWLGAKLLPNLSPTTKLRIHAGAWAVFYIIYFWRMGF